MTACFVLLILLALIVSAFIAADISDTEYRHRPESQNYD